MPGEIAWNDFARSPVASAETAAKIGKGEDSQCHQRHRQIV
jgi:hypothetical protein